MLLGVGAPAVPLGDVERDGVELGAPFVGGRDATDGAAADAEAEPPGGRAPAARCASTRDGPVGVGVVEVAGPAVRVVAGPRAATGAADPRGATAVGTLSGEVSPGSGTPPRRLTTTAPVPTMRAAITARMPNVVTTARRPESSTKTAPRAACLPTASTPSESAGGYPPSFRRGAFRP